MTRAIRYLLVIAVLAALPAASFGAVFLSVSIAPPLLPVYTQPLCPGPGYIWTPGYWGYGTDGYFWVPGTWVLAPFTGALWTPGYWGWGSGVYMWHAGYWGPQVGFYGGIDYGFGYGGVGYNGGYWNHGSFYYNSAVNHVDRNVVRNVYSKNVVNRGGEHISYNGGHGGINARPTSAEMAAARQRHSGATAAQTQLRRNASVNRAQLASVNHGRPEVAATAKPTEFHGQARASSNRTTHTPASTAHATRTPAHRPATRVATPNRATASKHTAAPQHSAIRTPAPAVSRNRPAVSHNHAVAHRAAPAAPHYSARNNRPAARSHVPVQHTAVRHSAPAQHSEPVRRSAPVQHRASAPRPESAPHARGASTARREGHHG